MLINTYRDETVGLKITPGLKEKLSQMPTARPVKKPTTNLTQAIEVLLIDDDAQYLEEMAELLESKGYSCHKSTSASSALRILSENKDIAILLVDYFMPNHNGLDLILSLKAGIGKQMDYKYVLMTRKVRKDTAIKLLRLGIDNTIAKPVDTGQLLKMMAGLKNKVEITREIALRMR